MMRSALSLIPLFLTFVTSSVSLQSLGETEHASSPPRGWNSYDSFCWTISEQEFLQNAQIVANRLRPHGYNYVVVDFLWYRRNVSGANVDSLGFDVIDQWGRMVPDPDRWPSSRNGNGFKSVADKVHSMGLQFGIHVMRGISTQAFNANTPILDVTTGKAYEESGRQWRAKDIGIKERACAWMKNGFMSVNAKSGAGRAFLRSLYQQYADWGVDFVKHDCVFGADLDLDEITYVSSVLKSLDRPIIYSLSPGTGVTPAMAKDVNGLVNMYRITGDDWDTWKDVAAHFNVTRDLAGANLIGASGLHGKSWPDLDMLPLGWLTDPGSNEGPHRKCNLTLDEQRTQMTLWSMAKSPLMFGGDMRNLDDSTFSIITNPTLLEINFFSSNNKEFPYISSTKKGSRFIHHAAAYQSRTLKTEEPLTLGLTSCEDVAARGWSARAINDDDLGQVCWKDESNSGNNGPFCLYKRKSLLLLDEETTYKQHYDGKIHLLKRKMYSDCLGASPNRRLNSRDFVRGSFSPCGWKADQMWELTHNGTLMNGYSGLCASMKTSKANAGPEGPRAWIATGRKGEIYIAVFNLDDVKAEVTIKIADLGKVLRGKPINTRSCKGREEWSGKEVAIVNDSVSTQVEVHGSALFVLNCT